MGTGGGEPPRGNDTYAGPGDKRSTYAGPCDIGAGLGAETAGTSAEVAEDGAGALATGRSTYAPAMVRESCDGNTVRAE